MDLSTLNTAGPAERGSALHLKHPALGHLLYTGDGASEMGELIDESKAEPVLVFVRGIESKSAREFARALHQARMKLDEKRPSDLAAIEKIGLDFAVSLVVGFSGLERDGKPLEATEENIRAFLSASDEIVSQVTEFAQDKRNFFAKGSAN